MRGRGLHKGVAALGVGALAAVMISGCGSGNTDRTTVSDISGGVGSFATPSYPPPPAAAGPRHLTISPGTDLTDGRQVLVHGTGYRAGLQVIAVTCAAESDTLKVKSTGCDTTRSGTSTTDATGAFTLSYVVRRVIKTPAVGQVDCAERPERCKIGVGEQTTGDGAPAPISFRTGLPPVPPPASYVRQLVVTPSISLTDNQTLQLQGTGYQPGVRIAAVTCIAEADTLADKQTGCDTRRVVYGTTDASGNFSLSYIAGRVLATTAVGPVDCASSPARCKIGVGELESSAGASAPVSFLP
jgi:hypothetical protein